MGKQEDKSLIRQQTSALAQLVLPRFGGQYDQLIARRSSLARGERHKPSASDQPVSTRPSTTAFEATPSATWSWGPSEVRARSTSLRAPFYHRSLTKAATFGGSLLVVRSDPDEQLVLLIGRELGAALLLYRPSTRTLRLCVFPLEDDPIPSGSESDQLDDLGSREWSVW